MFRRTALLSSLFLSVGFAAVCPQPAPDRPIEFLSWDDLVALSATAWPDEALAGRLQTTLSTPAIYSFDGGAAAPPRRPVSPGSGPVLRIAEWNIDGGRPYDQIRDALAGASSFGPSAKEAAGKRSGVVEAQLRELGQSDVIVLNEVDVGIPSSGYRDVALDLARDLGMNMAFGVEFVEVDPLDLGLADPTGTPEQIAEWSQDYPADPARYRGLTGNAVLSRYPILSARIIRLPGCYDWYAGEMAELAELEKKRRWTAERVFEERVARQVRHGGRMALVVELAVPESPTGVFTVVATHLENRARPECRQEQMAYLLALVRDVKGPVVLAGDFNTSGIDVSPTSFRREVLKRATSLKFWLGQTLWAFAPLGMARLGTLPLNYMKNFQDPSAFSIPFVMPNGENGFFDMTRKFRFTDNGRFDFRGHSGDTRNGNGGALANSNERSWKGFTPTYAFTRTLADVVGFYKLDWFFVKPAVRPGKGCGSFAPHRPMTLNQLNEASGERISDHAPIIVDLYLTHNGG